MNLDTHPHPSKPPVSQSNGAVHPKGKELARRAMAMLSALPSEVDAQVKSRPYAAIGAAFAIGIGTGVFFSSRLVRAAVVAVAASAAAAAGSVLTRQAVGGERHPGRYDVEARSERAGKPR